MSRANRSLSAKIALALLLFTAAVVALYLLRPLADPDFFWHLKTGQWILQNQGLPGVDPFSLSPPAADNLRASFILTSYWLSQLLYALLYALGGWWGIVLLRLVLVGAIAGIYASRADLRQPVKVCLLLLVSVQLLEVYPLDRPQMFSFVFFAGLLVLLDRYRHQAEGEDHIGSFAAGVAALMLIWSNLHGGFLVGQVTLVLFLGMEGLRFLHPALSPLSRKRYGGLGLLILAGLAASFVNPNGLNSFKLLLTINETNNFLYTTNVEYYSSLRILREYQSYTVLLNWLMIGLVAGRALTTIKRPDITWLTLLAGTAYMGCQHVRYLPFFLLAALLYLGQGREEGKIALPLKTLFVVTTLFLALWFVRDEGRNLSAFIRGEWGPDRDFPARAADFTLEKKLRGPIYNTSSWGGYLIWRLGPERKIYCDGRLLDTGRYWEYLSTTIMTQGATAYWREIFRKNGIETAILQMVDPSAPAAGLNPLAAALRLDPAWRLVFTEDNAAVFIRLAGYQ